MKLRVPFLSSLLALGSACPYDDCDHLDLGSCGVACCKLSFDVAGESTEEVMQKLNSTIHAFGPDKRYIPMITAEGGMGFGDLRPYGGSHEFIGQAWHTTTNLKYNDTLNFTVEKTAGGSRVRAFSISQLGGSLGDDGQNFYNIKQLMDSITWLSPLALSHVDESCPPPAKV